MTNSTIKTPISVYKVTRLTTFSQCFIDFDIVDFGQAPDEESYLSLITMPRVKGWLMPWDPWGHYVIPTDTVPVSFARNSINFIGVYWSVFTVS